MQGFLFCFFNRIWNKNSFSSSGFHMLLVTNKPGCWHTRLPISGASKATDLWYVDTAHTGANNLVYMWGSAEFSGTNPTHTNQTDKENIQERYRKGLKGWFISFLLISLLFTPNKNVSEALPCYISLSASFLHPYRFQFSS